MPFYSRVAVMRENWLVMHLSSACLAMQQKQLYAFLLFCTFTFVETAALPYLFLAVSSDLHRLPAAAAAAIADDCPLKHNGCLL